MHIVDTIYDAVDEPEALAALPARLAAALGARSATIQIFGKGLDLEQQWYNHFDGEMVDYYHRHQLYRHDRWTQTNLDHIGLDRAGRHSDYLPLGDFKASLYYNDFIRRFGDDSAHCMGFVATRGQGGLAVVGWQKAAADKDFDRADLATCEQLRPHLTRFAEIQRRLGAAREGAALARTALDASADAFMLVGLGRELRFANRAAEELLRNGSFVCLPGAKLHFSNANDDLAFAAALDAIANGHADAPFGFRIEVDRPGEGRRCLVLPRNWNDRRHALLWVEGARESRDAGRLLARLYDLTETEGRIMLLAGQGLPARQIADRMQVTVATVRTHLQHVYQKTDSNRASQLARLVASLPPLH